MLGPVGLSDDEERVYRILLETPRSTISQVARVAHLGTGQVRKLAASLEAKGFVSLAPGAQTRLMPAPPDLAVDALVRMRQGELDRALVEAMRLAKTFRARIRETELSQPVEIFSGRDAMHHRFLQVQRGASEEVLILDRPPYVFNPPRTNPEEQELLARGVRFRVIYDRRSFDAPEKLVAMQTSVEAGESARTFNGVPLKATIADRRIALTYDMSAEAILTGVVIHPSPLLDALLFLFERMWDLAIPVGAPPGVPAGELDAPDRRILSLLAIGLKDDAIAREMRVSHRTVQRRVSEILLRLGVTSRFQAGLQAARRGLL